MGFNLHAFRISCGGKKADEYFLASPTFQALNRNFYLKQADVYFAQEVPQTRTPSLSKSGMGGGKRDAQ